MTLFEKPKTNVFMVVCVIVLFSIGLYWVIQTGQNIYAIKFALFVMIITGFAVTVTAFQTYSIARSSLSWPKVKADLIETRIIQTSDMGDRSVLYFPYAK